MPVEPQWKKFPSSEALAERFASDVAKRLGDAIKARGQALIAVSGGTTPALFFRALSRSDIDWSCVTVVPVDERFVPPASERSNEKLIRGDLLTNKALDAAFIPLFHDVLTAQEAAIVADGELSELPLPFDVVVLGMGSDGHTASFFPDAKELASLIDPKAERRVMPVLAESAGEPRITLTLPTLISAAFVALHIEGSDKRAVLEAALAQPAPHEKPISAVLFHASSPLQIYWAPKKGEEP